MASPVRSFLACAIFASICSIAAPDRLLADTPPVANEPLHQRIDAAVEHSAIGPMAALCTDADFVRRIYLDLTGVIPSHEQVETFLADDAPDKRARLIDTLIEGPEFARHFAVQLNVLLLDRRTDTTVDQKAWEAYLIDSIARRKPLDQIFQELIDPSGTDDPATPARKFLLNRDAEPHAMTRDVGRMVFGMDMQCAQCHDHPIIDDYYQADYYGLFAFLNRTTKFTDPKSKLIVLSEKAEGEAPFESVFTGEGRETTLPRVPWGATLYDEPTFSAEEAYQVKPDKENAGKPSFSRREALAKRLSENEQFRRNIANRVWALVLGRGLVHPTDFHYAENPPVNPELLALLTDDLAQHKFDLHYAVRQIVLSKTYQRSCEPPAPETLNLADIRSRLDALTQRQEPLIAAADQLKEQVETTKVVWQEALAVNDEVAEQLPPLEEKLAQSRTAAEKATAEHAEAQKAYAALTQRAEPIQTVLTATKAAIEKVADEPALKESLVLLEKRSGELAAEMTTAKAELDKKMEALTAAKKMVETTEAEVATVLAKRITPERLTELELAHLSVVSEAGKADATARLAQAQIELCQSILDYPAIALSDSEKAEVAWEAIVNRWTLQGQVAPLKPLTPEQLAASAMQATGFLARSQTAAQAAVEKTPPKALEAEGITDEEKALVTQIAVQGEMLNQLRGSVNQFVGQFGGLSGEEFQATVNQALFLGNSPTVNNWLAAAGDTLVGRLNATEQPTAIADPLCLAVLSRPATLDEQREIANFLTETVGEEAGKRPAALAELVWAMITSNEFRFNH
ncbi:MAG: DUF1549 domain-containing protein [Pirellulaceae bacterium]